MEKYKLLKILIKESDELEKRISELIKEIGVSYTTDVVGRMRPARFIKVI